MYRAAALACLVSSACVVGEDAKPILSTIELSKSTELAPNETITIRVTGSELWGRPLKIEVYFAPEFGAHRMVRELSTKFDEEQTMQTASTTWTLDPALLRDAGTTGIYFVAIAEGARLESGALYVETQPALLDIELIAPTPIVEGSELTVRVTGTDVWSQGLDVTVLRNGAPIASLEAPFDGTLSQQTAHASWRVAGDFLDRAGRSEIKFRATLGDLSIESEAAIIEIRSEITSLALFRNGPRRGRLPLQAGSTMPVVEELVLAVSGTALVGLTSTITVYRTPNIVLAVDHVSASNSFEHVFRPEAVDLGAQASIDVYFEVAVGGGFISSPLVVIERSGFYACDFFLTNGQVLEDHATVPSGTTVVLRAEMWGIQSASGGFDIWEQDDTSDDDFVERVGTTLDMYFAETEWNAVYTDDGTFQTEAEYYFLGDIDGRECRSPLLIVEE